MRQNSRIKLYAIIAAFLLVVVLVLYAFVSFSAITSKGIKEWNVDDVSISSAKGTCQVNVYNPNWYSLNCKKLKFFLYYKEKEVGKAELLTSTNLAGNTETLLPLNFEFDFSSLGLSDLYDLAKDSVEFQTVLKGEATWLNLSFEEKGNITLTLKDWLKSKLPSFNPGDWFKMRSFIIREIGFPVLQAAAPMGRQFASSI